MERSLSEIIYGIRKDGEGLLINISLHNIQHYIVHENAHQVKEHT